MLPSGSLSALHDSRDLASSGPWDRRRRPRAPLSLHEPPAVIELVAGDASAPADAVFLFNCHCFSKHDKDGGPEAERLHENGGQRSLGGTGEPSQHASVVLQAAPLMSQQKNCHSKPAGSPAPPQPQLPLSLWKRASQCSKPAEEAVHRCGHVLFTQPKNNHSQLIP